MGFEIGKHDYHRPNLHLLPQISFKWGLWLSHFKTSISLEILNLLLEMNNFGLSCENCLFLITSSVWLGILHPKSICESKLGITDLRRHKTIKQCYLSNNWTCFYVISLHKTNQLATGKKIKCNVHKQVRQTIFQNLLKNLCHHKFSVHIKSIRQSIIYVSDLDLSLEGPWVLCFQVHSDLWY